MTRTRAYSGSLGRWISRDVVELEDNTYSYCENAPSIAVDPLGLAPEGTGTMWESKTFQKKTGTPADMLDQWGCIAVVDNALGIPFGVPPESVKLPGRKCWWGNKGDVGPGKNKAKNCKEQCPKGTHKVIWCKQGYMEQTSRGKPGTSVSDPAAGWDSSKQAAGQWNYSLYDPETDTFSGADSAGAGCGYTGSSMPLGSVPAENASFCCRDCVKNK